MVDITTRLNVTGFTENSYIITLISFAYNLSYSFRSNTDAWLQDHPNDQITIVNGFSTSSSPGSGMVEVEESTIDILRAADGNGIFFQPSLFEVILHELAHAIGNKYDNVTFDNLDGDAVDLANTWYGELGLRKRSSYQAGFEIGGRVEGLINQEISYSFGESVVNTVLGSVNRADYTGSGGVSYDPRDIDLLSLGVTGKSLIIGLSENNFYGGTTFRDFIYGGGGNDQINGYSGNDVIYGDSNTDAAIFGEDVIDGGAGADTIVGGPSSANGVDDIRGGDGNDTIYGDFGINGPSTIDLSLGYKDIISGGLGADFINGQQGDDVINGNEGADTLIGGDGNDVISGGANSDTISGDAGEDVIFGDGGIDTIHGGLGADTIVGGAGGDFLYGDDGDDYLKGEGGSDTLYSGSGSANNLDGEGGSDTIIFDSGGGVGDGGLDSDVLVAEAGAGFVTLQGGRGNDRLYGNGGITKLYGDEDSDLLVTSSDGNELYGGAGSDYLEIVSDLKSAILVGGTGNDVIDARARAVTPSDGFEDQVYFEFRAGDGHDVFLGDGYANPAPAITTWSNGDDEYHALGWGIDEIRLLDLSINDVTFVWQIVHVVSEFVGGSGDTAWHTVAAGNLALVVNATGESIYLGNVAGSFLTPDGNTLFQGDNGDTATLRSISLPRIVFADEALWWGGDGAWTNGHFRIGPVSQYNTALAEFQAATSGSDFGAAVDLTGAKSNSNIAAVSDVIFSGLTPSSGTIATADYMLLSENVDNVQLTRDVVEFADTASTLWLPEWDMHASADPWSRFERPELAGPYSIQPMTHDVDAARAANLMVQAMSMFGAKGGIDDGTFNTEASFGIELIAVADRVERFQIRSNGPNLA